MNGTPPLLSDSFDWYVARVEHGKEAQASVHLLNVGFIDVFYPKRRVESKRPENPSKLNKFVFSGVRPIDARSRIFPFWSGYVFCETRYFSPWLWHDACPAEGHKNHRLIYGFLGGWPPDPVSNQCIQDLRARCDSEGIVIEVPKCGVTYLPGALVRVLNDPRVPESMVFRVVFDTGLERVQLRTVQNENIRIYPCRDDIEPIVTNPGWANKVQQRSAGLRGKGRLFRRVRSSVRAAVERGVGDGV